MSRIPIVTEVSTVDLSDAELAAIADVDEACIAAVRAGIPHWRLEAAGVLERIAHAIGTPPEALRSQFSKAKAIASGQRGHGQSTLGSFPGQSHPLLRS